MSKSMFGGGGNRGLGSTNYKLETLKNIVLGYYATTSTDPLIDNNNIKNYCITLLDKITNSTNTNDNNSIFTNFLNNITTISGSIIDISTEIHSIDASLNDISMGAILSMAETISGSIMDISTEIHSIDASLNDISMGAILSMAETISGSIMDISYEINTIESSLSDISMGSILSIGISTKNISQIILNSLQTINSIYLNNISMDTILNSAETISVTIMDLSNEINSIRDIFDNLGDIVLISQSITNNIIGISNEINTIDASLSDISMGAILSMAETISENRLSISYEITTIESSFNTIMNIIESIHIIDVYNEIHAIDASLSDISMGAILSMAETISGNRLSISYEITTIESSFNELTSILESIHIIDVSNEIHAFDASLSDISMGAILSIAENISTTIISISYEINKLENIFFDLSHITIIYETISTNIMNISNEIHTIDASLSDISMGVILSIAETISGTMIGISNEIHSIEMSFNELNTISWAMIGISNEIHTIDASLNDISMGLILSIAETISGNMIGISNEIHSIEMSFNDLSTIHGDIIDISNEIHTIDASLNDISFNIILSIAETISGTMIDVSSYFFIIKKQLEYIYLETSNNTIWNDSTFQNWMIQNSYTDISYDLCYTKIEQNIITIEQSMNSVQDTSLIEISTNYKSILESISFESIELSLNHIHSLLETITPISFEPIYNLLYYDNSLIEYITNYKSIVESISFESIELSLNTIYSLLESITPISFEPIYNLLYYDSSFIEYITNYKNILENISLESIELSLNTIYDISLIGQILSVSFEELYALVYYDNSLIEISTNYKSILESISFESIELSLNTIYSLLESITPISFEAIHNLVNYDNSFIEYITNYKSILESISFESIEISLNAIYNIPLIGEIITISFEETYTILDSLYNNDISKNATDYKGSLNNIYNSLNSISLQSETINNDSNVLITISTNYQSIVENISFSTIEISLNSIYNTSLIENSATYKSILENISFLTIQDYLNSIYDSSLIENSTSYKSILENISFELIYESIQLIHDNSLQVIYNNLDTDLSSTYVSIIYQIQESTRQIGEHVTDIKRNIYNIDINKIN